VELTGVQTALVRPDRAAVRPELLFGRLARNPLRLLFLLARFGELTPPESGPI
jgi:hypothetical protein